MLPRTLRFPIVAAMMLFAAGACASAPQVASVQSVSSDAEPAAAVKARFMEGIEAFNRHDVDAFVAQFSDDVEMYTPTGWLRGSSAVRTRFVETFAQFPKVRMEIEALRSRVVAPDTVVVDFTWRVFPMGAGPAFHGLSSGVYVNRNGAWVEVLEHETVVKVDAPLPGSER